MSYRDKATYKATITGDFTSGTDKWTGAEVQAGFTDMADSVQWIDAPSTITFGSTFTFDCSGKNTQTITLTGNATMSIANAITGADYRLLVFQDGTGSRTLTLPSGKTNGGVVNSTAGSCTVINFFTDGTYYYFSLGQYS